MTIQHIHADILRAIADGKEVEGNYTDFGDKHWYTANSEYNPMTHPSHRWRIKPEKQVLKYRVALMDDGIFYTTTVDNEKDARYLKEQDYFVHWLGDWKEAEMK